MIRRKWTKAMVPLLVISMVLTGGAMPDQVLAASKKVELKVSQKQLYVGGPNSFRTAKVAAYLGKKKIKVSFTSSNKAIVNVTKTTGKITAKKKGTAKIRVRYQKRTYSCTIQVKPFVYMKALSSSVTKLSLDPMQKKKWKVKVVPGNATYPALSYRSSNHSVAVVDKNGMITAKAAGEAVITATAKDGSLCVATVTVQVRQKPQPTLAPSPTVSIEPQKTGIESVSSLSAKDFTLQVGFYGSYTKEDLKNTSLCLSQGDRNYVAVYKESISANSAVYQITDANQRAALCPGDTSADGDYLVTSMSEKLPVNEKLTTSYQERLTGNLVTGYVTYWNQKGTDKTEDDEYEPVKGATVQIKNGKSAVTDETGFYSVYAESGIKTMIVKADGYQDNIVMQKVKVGRNTVTAQNFKMVKIDESRISANITVQDGSNAVKDAKVTLCDALGQTIGTPLMTDREGKVTFANSNASGKDSDYLKAGKIYTLLIEKGLSADNWKEVYTQKKVSFKLDSVYNNTLQVQMEANKVPAMPSLTIQENFAEDAVQKLTKKMVWNSFELYTTVNTEGKTPEKILSATPSNASMVENKQATIDLIRQYMWKAALPTGDYYLVARPDDTESAGYSSLSTVVVKMTLQAGKAAKTSLLVTTGRTCKWNLQVNLNATEQDSQKGDESSTAPLHRAVKSGMTYQIATDLSTGEREDVKADFVISQKMPDGIQIPVYSSSERVQKSSGQYIATAFCNNLLSAEDYSVRIAGKYIMSQQASFVSDAEKKKTFHYDTKAACNLKESKIFVKGALVGKKISELSLDKIVVRDAVSDAVVTEKEYDRDTMPQMIPLSNTGNAAIRLSQDTILSYGNGILLSNLDETICDLPSGKYVFEYNLNGYKTLKSDAISVIGLESISPVIENNIQSDPMAKSASVSGKVCVRMADGDLMNNNDLINEALAGISVTLLDADGKIAGYDRVSTADGTYCIRDGVSRCMITGGMYTLVCRFARGGVAETTVIRNVAIRPHMSVTCNIEARQGGKRNIKATVTSKEQESIRNLIGSAFDEWYVDYSQKENWVIKAVSPSLMVQNAENDRLMGKYSGVLSDESPKEMDFCSLSAGYYQLNFGQSDGNTFNFGKESIVLDENAKNVYESFVYGFSGVENDVAHIKLKYIEPTTQDYYGASNADATGKQCLVFDVRDEEGNLIYVKGKPAVYYIDTKQSNAAAGTEQVILLTVPASGVYQIQGYRENGYLVAQKKVIIQKFDSTQNLGSFDRVE